jgi:hypothetical protein
MRTIEMVGIPQLREAVRNFHPMITARPQMPVRLGLAPYQQK